MTSTISSIAKISSTRHWPTALILIVPKIYNPNFPFRKIAGTPRATARAISGSTWTAIIIPSSRSPAGRAPRIRGFVNGSPICGCLDYTHHGQIMLIRLPHHPGNLATRRKKSMTAWPAIMPVRKNLAAHRHGEKAEENPCADAGTDHPVQSTFCHSRLG